MIWLKLNGLDALLDRIAEARDTVFLAIAEAVSRATIRIQADVVSNYLSGQVLKNRTGTLRRSINQEVKVEGYDVIGTVGTNVEYAAIHEYGGTIHHPGGTAYMATPDGLRFIRNDNPLSGRLPRTRAHDIPIPQRAFLHPALEAGREPAVRDVRAAVERAVRLAVADAG